MGGSWRYIPRESALLMPEIWAARLRVRKGRAGRDETWLTWPQSFGVNEILAIAGEGRIPAGTRTRQIRTRYPCGFCRPVVIPNLTCLWLNCYQRYQIKYMMSVTIRHRHRLYHPACQRLPRAPRPPR